MEAFIVFALPLAKQFGISIIISQFNAELKKTETLLADQQKELNEIKKKLNIN
jgi:hypothetical protein